MQFSCNITFCVFMEFLSSSSLVDLRTLCDLLSNTFECYLSSLTSLLSYRSSPFRAAGAAVIHVSARLSMTVFGIETVSSLLEKWIELAVANELGGCNLEQCSAYTIRFHSLKKLALEGVHIDEQLVQKNISECPLLEDSIQN
ncbi:hypothetical protein Ddye_027056 [Dipteronia dyeriana]|uniref:Uncharacterized protein n=1 Tax=Dipteronia dyeriana TaxID=168575 RepID=A0AAD9TP09_9ROSI|nr:hypothetical protein Ddye_027056 [Dipteronia dyeriana]